MKTSPLADRVTIRTREEWGAPINSHTFRHIAATEIATHDPANVTDIKAVLGHSRTGVGEKHYNRARMLDAAERHQASVAARRNGRR
jgi:integrase